MNSVPVNKSQLLQQIVSRLGESLSVLEKAARASHAEATDESSKAESKYDTRGLEAAYLAGGQARQVKEIHEAIQLFQDLDLRNFSAGDPIDLTALVELETNGVSSTYFIGPKNGGLEVEFQRREITVITPQSPLGQNLVGKKAGQRWTAKLGGATVKYHVVSVR
jgi:transcription elongation GreA/GreB family factor